MSSQVPEPGKREHPSTYMVQDRSSQEELDRLRIQDQLLTTGMGGVLAEQPDVSIFHQVLDVGCGTGGWLLDLARAYPHIAKLVGADVSTHMINYARQQASKEGLSERVTFHVMDALRRLDFPQDSFDLVNQRLNFSYLRTWDWPKLLSEYRRVTRPEGIIRISETNVLGETNSPAFTQLYNLAVDAFYQAGHLFQVDSESVPNELPHLMEQQGVENVQTHVIPFEYHAGDPGIDAHYENITLFFRTILPFLRKWTQVPENYEDIYKQAVVEMRQPGFVVAWKMVTVWGSNPS